MLHASFTKFSFLLPISSVFFYCYGDPRDLHSFPTRRSSDLVSNLQSFIASMTQKLTLSDISDESKNYPKVLTSDRKSGSAGMPRPISYAVFCLKKKKTNRRKNLSHSRPLR